MGNCLQNVDIYKLAYLSVRPLITFQASKLNLRCRCDTKTGGPRANREIQIYNKSRSYSVLQNICQNYERFDWSKNVSFIALEY